MKKATKKRGRKPMNIEMAETKEVIKVEKKEIETPKITKDTIIEYLNAFGFSGLNDNEKKQFIEIAVAFNLNPFKREIYCIPYGQGSDRRLSIMTGYEVYLKRASRLNVLNGWNVKIEGEGQKAKAILTIYRKDWNEPFTHEVYMNEYNTQKSLWATKPITMLKKVAVAQGFRLAFPDEFGGMPYTSDELPDEMTTPKAIPSGVMKAESEKIDLITEIKIEYERVKGKLDKDKILYVNAALANPNIQKVQLEELLTNLKNEK